MNLIPRKYPNTPYWFMTDWTIRAIGDPDTRWTILWSRETHGFDLDDWNDWTDWTDWNDWTVWFVWRAIEVGISETHPGVSNPSEVIL